MDFDRETNPQANDPATTGGATPGLGGTPGLGATPGSEPAGGSQIGDPGTRAGSYDRKFIAENESMKEQIGDKLDEGRGRVGQKLDEGRQRVSGVVDSGKNRIAGQMERIGDRIEERAHGLEESGGVQRRAGEAALRASEALDSGADYIRTHDPAEMRDDLEVAIRERPLFSVGVAMGAGFLLARLLRD